MTVSPPTLSRRTLGKAAVTALAAAVVGCGGARYHGPVRRVTIAGGQHGGVYLRFAHSLAREINAAEPDLRCRVVESGGSVTNIDLIRSGRADVGLCQADIALAAVNGTDPYRAPVPIRGIGRMYEDYLQLVVRANSPLRSVTDLDGRTVSIGAVGSGTAIFAQRLIDAAGVRVETKQEPLNAALAALERGRIDAVLWCGGMPTPALNDLHDGVVRIRLLPIAEVFPTLRSRYHTAYQQVNIPAGGYGRAGMPTVGVANLLLCGDSLPTTVVEAITTTIVERADRLVPPMALGAQFLDRRTLIGLLGAPMHPGAAAAYRQLHG
jgi:uncharacterized protein